MGSGCSQFKSHWRGQVSGKESLLYFGCQPPRGGQSPVQSPPPPDHQWARAFTGWGRDLHAEIAQPSLAGILMLGISGLVSVILIILGTVSLQFHGRFASISLKPVLRIVAAYVMVTAWSSRNYLLHMVRVSASVRQLTGYGTAYNL